MFARLCFWLVLYLISVSTCFADEDPYKGLKFYYGDNHFHSGFSGDNVQDAHPIIAFSNAAQQVMRYGTNATMGGDPTEDLGGYFFFISDHIQYVPTRLDMTNDLYQVMQHEANDPFLDLNGAKYTFTVFPGGEVTGLARNISTVTPWDDKFGHLNVFNLQTISSLITNGFIYLKGTEAMDRLAKINGAIGQFNHPGYNNEPRIGDDANHLYPYTEARDKVFKFFEISDGQPNNWNAGVAQYNVCLQKGYHVSPVIGSDIHNTQRAFLFQPPPPFKAARTVVIAPPSLKMTHPNRRNLLLDSMRKGLVYASENSNLHVKISMNGFLMGHRFNDMPNKLTIRIDIEDLRNNPLKTIELVQNRKCIVPDGQVNNEQQCVKSIKSWSSDKTQFHVIYDIDPYTLFPLTYIYLKVTQANNDRAMTTPFFFPDRM